jgi:predicted membrane protein
MIDNQLIGTTNCSFRSLTVMNNSSTNSTSFSTVPTTGDYILIVTQSIAFVLCVIVFILLIIFRKEKTIVYRGVSPFTAIFGTLVFIARTFVYSFTLILQYTDE